MIGKQIYTLNALKKIASKVLEQKKINKSQKIMKPFGPISKKRDGHKNVTNIKT